MFNVIYKDGNPSGVQITDECGRIYEVHPLVMYRHDFYMQPENKYRGSEYCVERRMVVADGEYVYKDYLYKNAQLVDFTKV